jgi:HEAT repeat protein
MFCLDVFCETIKEEAIPKLVAKLEDDDPDVRTAAAGCMEAFSKQGLLIKSVQRRYLTFLAELYQNNIKLSIPTITKQLDNEFWGARQQAVQTLVQLFTLSACLVSHDRKTILIYMSGQRSSGRH